MRIQARKRKHAPVLEAFLINCCTIFIQYPCVEKLAAGAAGQAREPDLRADGRPPPASPLTPVLGVAMRVLNACTPARTRARAHAARTQVRKS